VASRHVGETSTCGVGTPTATSVCAFGWLRGETWRDHPMADGIKMLQAESRAGDEIGRYRVGKILGEGGMGYAPC